MAQIDHDKRIDYIELPVDDVDVSRTFYRTVFGWKFTDYGPDYWSFEDGRLSSGRRFHFTDPAGNELAVWSDV